MSSSIYFSDVNADGLPDLVQNGEVLFNYLVNGVPAFSKDSSQTAVPVGTGSIKIDPNKDELYGNNEYRKVVREYRTDSYYAKGLLSSETTFDGDNNPYRKTKNTFKLMDIDTQQVYPYNVKATVFPQLKRTNTDYYEGKAFAGASTAVEYTYTVNGNIKSYKELGSSGENDDVRVKIDYYSDPQNYIIKPKRVSVFDSDNNLLRYREAEYKWGTGDLVKLTQGMNENQDTLTEMEYYADGNLKKVIGPENNNGDRYTREYSYDEQTGTYIERIEDSFGYVSTAEYNYLFGQLKSFTDINGNQITRRYDKFGRLKEVYAPYDESLPAVEFEYYHNELPARSVTKNKIQFDPDNEETLDTVLFIDGLKRVVQTQKEGEVSKQGDDSTNYGMVISGKKIYDAFGRVVKQGQPVFRADYNTAYYPDVEMKNPTEMKYDILDREKETKLPDSSSIITEYSFEDNLMKTTITDPQGKVKNSYQDVRGNIVKVEEFKNGEAVLTNYKYNPLNEIVSIADNEENITRMTYNMLGQRKTIDSPDSGRVEYFYDNAGNVIEKVDSNLREKGQSIKYVYDYNRIKKIDYPESHDIEYSYGEMGAEYNRAGRVKKVTDESGSTEYFYGKLGEEVKNIKKIHFLRDGMGTWTYETEKGYDYLGRLACMVYPDGEKLTYKYDRGGKVNTVYGIKKGDRYDYIENIRYDEFGQRVYIKYANGTETKYDYDQDRRWLDNIKTENNYGNALLDIDYEFDEVGNVLGYENRPQEVRQSYEYDDLYQLVGAEGSGMIRNGSTSANYTQTFAYDSIGNITHKLSRSTIDNNSLPLDLNYKFTYHYDAERPHAPDQIGSWLYEMGFIMKMKLLILKN